MQYYIRVGRDFRGRNLPGVDHFIVYGLFDPRDGQLRYVGDTARGLRLRLLEHLRDARAGRRRHVYCWLRDLLAEGLEPDVCVLETCSSAEEMDQAEAFHIACFKYLGCELTNHDPGGRGRRGFKHSADSRAKMSAAHAGRPSNRRGSVASPETRAKMAAAHAARWAVPGFRERMSRAHEGRKLSPEHLAALVSANTGRVCLLQEQIHQSRIRGGRAITDENGTVYPSASAAARALGLCSAHVSEAAKHGKTAKGHFFNFVGDPAQWPTSA